MNRAAATMWEFIIGFLLGIYFWYAWSHPKVRPVQGGYRHDIVLPHTEELELYYHPYSANSRKVTTCLGETGLKFKSHIVHLPSAGSWESKKEKFLRINPAGTVPVLVHNGHPIYESHEQIVYINQNLVPPGAQSLSPDDPDKKAIVDKWVDRGAMMMNEVLQASDPWTGLEKRFGNVLPFMTLPMFAEMGRRLSWFTILYDWFMLPVIDAGSRKFVFMHTLFKIFGMEALLKMPPALKPLKLTRKAILHHLQEIDIDLKMSGGPYLCGEHYTLADVSLVAIFERMEQSRWWPTVENQFPDVKAYWDRIQEREGYKNSKPDGGTTQGHTIEEVMASVDKCKREIPWLKDIYEN